MREKNKKLHVAMVSRGLLPKIKKIGEWSFKSTSRVDGKQECWFPTGFSTYTLEECGITRN